MPVDAGCREGRCRLPVGARRLGASRCREGSCRWVPDEMGAGRCRWVPGG